MINPTDIAVVGIILLSALLAFARGLVREVLSIAGWVGAGLAALYGFAYAKTYLRQFISITYLADAITIIGIFVVALVVLSLISHQLAKLVRGSALGAVDRSLGFAFGAVRGAILVCLAYLFINWAWPPAEQAPWLREAKTLPLIAQGADFIERLIPDSTRSSAAAQANAVRDRAQGAIDAGQALQPLFTSKPSSSAGDGGKADPAKPGAVKGGAPPPDKGYSSRERSDMDRAIESNQ